MDEGDRRVRVIQRPDELATALAIRHEVFVVGQDVPPDLEVDGLDPVCTHLLAERRAPDGSWRALGTARLRPREGVAKAERVAVLDAARGTGLGRLLMEALEGEARRLGYREVVLNAQVQVLPFYLGLGYVAEGPIFDEAGIQHRHMRKAI